MLQLSASIFLGTDALTPGTDALARTVLPHPQWTGEEADKIEHYVSKFFDASTLSLSRQVGENMAVSECSRGGEPAADAVQSLRSQLKDCKERQSSFEDQLSATKQDLKEAIASRSL